MPNVATATSDANRRSGRNRNTTSSVNTGFPHLTRAELASVPTVHPAMRTHVTVKLEFSKHIPGASNLILSGTGVQQDPKADKGWPHCDITKATLYRLRSKSINRVDQSWGPFHKLVGGIHDGVSRCDFRIHEMLKDLQTNDRIVLVLDVSLNGGEPQQIRTVGTVRVPKR